MALLCAGVEVLYLVLGHHTPYKELLGVYIIVLPFVLSFSEQRIWRGVSESALGGAAMSLTIEIKNSISNGWWEPLSDTLASALGAAAIFVALRLAAHWTVRSLFRKIIVQPGTLCWTCAYDLTGNQSGICPECGTPTSPALRS